MKDKREMELVNSFKEYLEILIKDFKDIEYNKVRSEERSIELLAKDFVKDLTKLLAVLKTEVTITDVLYVPIEMFSYHMPVSITLDERFKTITIPDNLINLRKLNIDLGNNYIITAQGDPDHFNIIIKNKAITSPRLKDENPGGAILFYRIEKLKYSSGRTRYEHSIFIKNPLANLNFIKHYVSNLNFIKHYEESGDELVEKDDVPKVDVESVEEDLLWTEKSDNTAVSESENTETVQTDTNKTLNFSLPGPNGSKISINLSINISFD